MGGGGEGGTNKPASPLVYMMEKKRWLVVSQLVTPSTSLVQISLIRLPPGSSVLIGPQCPGWGQFLIG